MQSVKRMRNRHSQVCQFVWSGQLVYLKFNLRESLYILFFVLFVHQNIDKNYNYLGKKSFKMFSIIFKSMNSKNSRSIANQTSKFVIPTSNQQDSDHQSSYIKKTPAYQTLENHFLAQKTKPKLYGSGTLSDFQIQRNFRPLQQFLEEYGQKQTENQHKQSAYQIKLNLQNVQALQFEANNPIQDRLVFKKLKNIDALCLSIFDGHGGYSLADFASKKITQLIDQYLDKNLDQIQQGDQQKSQIIIKESIEWAYQQIEQKFYEILDNQFKTGNKDVLKIGSCGITAIIYSKIIIIANCGDSQSIIVTQDQKGLCYFKGNEQLSVNNAQQKARIQKQFGGIDDQVLVKNKHNKTYLKGFLEPTRTLGDYYLKKQKYYNKVATSPFKGPYLHCKPDISIIPIKSNFKYLIMASDGLWDFMSKKQIVRIIQERNEKDNGQSFQLTLQDLNRTYVQKLSVSQNQKLTQKFRNHVLRKCAKKKGKTMEDLQNIPLGQRRNYCDDISIITVDLKENP